MTCMYVDNNNQDLLVNFESNNCLTYIICCNSCQFDEESIDNALYSGEFYCSYGFCYTVAIATGFSYYELL